MQISEHSVRERAYYIWESEGRVHGRATAHWMRAETELHALAASADAPVAVKAKRAPARKAAAEAKPAAKAPVAKAVTTKPSTGRSAAAKPTAPKAAKASKDAVAAGLAARAKPARAPASLH